MLSVIVPVYNTESYLEKCLDSILTQTYHDLELILIDDGSTDNSGKICDAYAQKDSRVSVIHQKNAGQNKARKAGIDIAVGEYVTFVDSDDWLDTDTYQEIFAVMQEEYDMISYDHSMDRGDARQIIASTLEAGSYNRREIVENVIPRMRWDFDKGKPGIAATINKIYKKSLLIDTIKNLDYQMTLCEDAAIVYPLIMRSQRILITHCCGYHYVQRADSVWHSYTVDSFEKMLRYQRYMQKEIVRISTEHSDITSDVISQFEEQQTQAILRVINNIMREVYHVNYNMVKWCPPYAEIPLRSRIVLYGAGDVGQAYHVKFYGDLNYNIVLWVDKKYHAMKGVKAPECLLETEYDVVLIAVESESLAKQIKENLIAMGVIEDKILWQKPKPILF